MLIKPGKLAGDWGTWGIEEEEQHIGYESGEGNTGGKNIKVRMSLGVWREKLRDGLTK